MAAIAKWIWLPRKQYPGQQNTIYSAMAEDKTGLNLTVAEFKRDYVFDSEVTEAQLFFSGDTVLRLYLSGTCIAVGPVNVGGDFLFNDVPRSKHYASRVVLHPHTKELNFRAEVRMGPVLINEYSRGHGGFMLYGKLTLADGRVKYICTDSTWAVRGSKGHVGACEYVQCSEVAFTAAEEIPDIWHCEVAPLKLLQEEIVKPVSAENFILAPGECRTEEIEFDRIYAGYVGVDIALTADQLTESTAGAHDFVELKVECIETDQTFAEYRLCFCGTDSFRGFPLQSVGKYRISAVNGLDHSVDIKPYLIASCYPVEACAVTMTDDEDLNLVLDVCRHTLKYCRQMIHLDSPKHSEPLACTGDYYIESLMTAMSFGDMDLAEFDIVRTAELLRMHDGRMFHTSYSLIWVLMLWDVYQITGKKELLEDCGDALHLLLDRFETYVGDNGLLETPPDFMFIDWIYIDEISMHHPPKALGQTSLCAFYYGALQAAAKVFEVLEEYTDQRNCLEKALRLQSAVNTLLYDPETGLYFDGMNTSSPEEMIYQYLPQNVERRYYMPHSNILCACFGVCSEQIGRKLIVKVAEDDKWGACQPYFMHFLLEGIFKLELRDEYTCRILEKWKAPVKECPKGLVEGFIMPEPAYSFDHSHAWGGTPLYALPKALLGLEILEPAYRKIRLNPSLLGLKKAHVEIPTPYGMITAKLEEGHDPFITVPAEVILVK